MSEVTPGWAHDWPLPSWLVADAGDTGPHALQVTLADGTQHAGQLNAALLDGRTLTLHWAGQAQPEVLPWDHLTSVILKARLAPRVRAGVPGEPGQWDAQIPHQLMPWHIRLSASHGGADFKGQTLGYLAASYGLFLYTEQADGSFRAEWYSSLALAFVQVGSKVWHTGRGRADDTPQSPAASPAGEPHELAPQRRPRLWPIPCPPPRTLRSCWCRLMCCARGPSHRLPA
jgi:hypothetical protein